MPSTFPLMLFAAGFGTRMGELSAQRPKPLIEVAGRPLIDHALALADDAPTGPIVVNLHYLPDQIRAHLSRRPDIALSQETPDILDTGGGLRQALPLLGNGPVMTLNTDAVWTGPNPISALAAAWDPARMDALLLLVPRDNARGHTGPGDFALDRNGRLSRDPGEPLTHVYCGTQIIVTTALATIPDRVYSLNRLWDLIAAKDRLYGLIHTGGWCDVGRPDSIPIAEALLREARGV